MTELESLDETDLLTKALECLHSLNRRAKHMGDEKAVVYALKMKLLDCLTKARLTTVQTWTWDRESLHAESEARSKQRWFVVQCKNYRFHQTEAEATPAMRAIATAGTPHEPTQTRREIPDVGLSVENQFRCVRMMIARLDSAKSARQSI